VRLRLRGSKHAHEWKIVYVGRDMLKYFEDELEPVPAAAAGDTAVGKGCMMRVCQGCGAREILRDVHFEDGPAARDRGSE
jgi:hypothetical protein